MWRAVRASLLFAPIVRGQTAFGQAEKPPFQLLLQPKWACIDARSAQTMPNLTSETIDLPKKQQFIANSI
jgi:hypothetical protein